MKENIRNLYREIDMPEMKGKTEEGLIEDVCYTVCLSFSV